MICFGGILWNDECSPKWQQYAGLVIALIGAVAGLYSIMFVDPTFYYRHFPEVHNLLITIWQ